MVMSGGSETLIEQIKIPISFMAGVLIGSLLLGVLLWNSPYGVLALILSNNPELGEPDQFLGSIPFR